MSKRIHRLSGGSSVVIEPDDLDISTTDWGPRDPHWHLHANSAYLLLPDRLKYGHSDPQFSPYVICHLVPLGDAQLSWSDTTSQAILEVGLPELFMQPVFETEGSTQGANPSSHQEILPSDEQKRVKKAPKREDRPPTHSHGSRERSASFLLVLLILATIIFGAVLNAVLGNAQLAFIGCVVFFGLGLKFGDGLLPRE